MDAEKWWYEIGSGMAPQPGEDWHEHASRVCKAAFLAGQSDTAKAQEFCEWLQGRLGSDQCRYDHDGHCQEHSDGSKWTQPCRKPQLDEWLKKRSKS